ncbi:MAG: hypothetical protein HC883_05050 [Bdellovibrionaceae bacterium]|nr:hypothetical protein [Pseudobdellovibrionaceae bacterium]
MDSYSHTAPFNVSTFWQEFFLRRYGPSSWFIAGVAIIFVVLWLPKRYAIIGVAVFFAFNIALQVRYHAPNTRSALERSVATLDVRRLYKPGTCIGFDVAGLDGYDRFVFWHDFGFQLYDYDLMRVDYDRWQGSCDGPLFSYNRQLLGDASVVPIAISPRGGPLLFARTESSPPTASDFYPIEISYRQPLLARILASGWHAIEGSHVWSDRKATLKLPMPARCYLDACTVEIAFGVYGASHARPVDVIISRSAAGRTEPLQSITATDSSIRRVLLALGGEKIEDLEFNIPEAISPQALRGSRDSRVLGIDLRTIDVK